MYVSSSLCSRSEGLNLWQIDLAKPFREIHPAWSLFQVHFFPLGDHATPLPCELLLLCYRVGFGQAVGAAAALSVCTENPALPGSTGTFWGQQVRRAMVQLSLEK